MLIFFVFFTSSIIADTLPQKTYDPTEVSFGSGKDAKKYILMNNGLDINRWYYASLNPKLVEYGDPLEPDIMMIKFQIANNQKKNRLHEGALFRCSFDIGADDSIIKKLKKSLPKEIDQNNVKLSIIPLDGIELSFFKPSSKKQVSIVASSTPIIPQIGSKVSFSTILDKEATVLMDTLLTSKMGVEYEIKYHYSVFSTPTTTSFTAKYNKNKAVISGYPKDLDPNLIKYIKNKENNPKFIQLLKTESEKNSKSKNDIKTSNSEEKVNLKNVGHKNKAKATKVSNISLNDFQKIINVTCRLKEDKISASSGFISFEKYGESILNKKVVQDTSYVDWNYAYLVMPTINDKHTNDIKQIEMLVELTHKKKVYEKRNYIWTKEKGWRNSANNNPATIDKFELDSDFTKSSSQKDSFFKVSTTIKFEKDDPLETELKLPVINGETPITTPFAFFDVLTFDFTSLTWDALKTNKSRLVSMEINIKDNKRRIKKIIEPKMIKGTKAIESPSFLNVLTNLNSFNDGNIKANICFKIADGKKVFWEYNDVVLNKYMDSTYIMFFDEDWKK